MIALKFEEAADVFISYNFFEKYNVGKTTIADIAEDKFHKEDKEKKYETDDLSFEEKLKIVTEKWSIAYNDHLNN